MLLATPAPLVPNRIGAVIPEPANPPRQVLSEVDLAVRWGGTRLRWGSGGGSSRIRGVSPSAGGKLHPTSWQRAGAACLGAVMAAMHEMLGVLPSSQGLRPCGSSLQGGAPQAVSHRLDLLLTALPDLFPPALRSRCALHRARGQLAHRSWRD